MKCNVGGGDRTMRWIAGIAFLAAGLFADVATGWRVLFFVLSAIALVTAYTTYCPLNQVLGIDTCRKTV